jgi:hypothetical protein
MAFLLDLEVFPTTNRVVIDWDVFTFCFMIFSYYNVIECIMLCGWMNDTLVMLILW